MEVSLIRDTTDHGNIMGPDTVSKSSHSQILLVPDDLLLANNEQETYKCDHFTIRGYVAEVREREMKHCWPLFKLDNHTMEGHPDLVPPLSVKKFRRWNCQNCLHRTIAPENVVEDRMIMNAQNYDEVQNEYRSSNANVAVSSHHPPVKYIASLPQQCKQKSPEEITVEKDSSIHGKNGESYSLQCLGQKDSNSVKEGTTISRSGQDRSYEDRKQESKKIVVAAGETCQRGAGNIAVGSNTSESSLIDKDTTGIVFSKRKDTELIHGIGDAQVSGKMITSMIFNLAVSDKTDDQGISEAVKGQESARNGVKDFLMPQGVDVTIQRDGAFPAVICHPSRHYFEGIDRGGHEATDPNLDIIDTMVHSQDDAKERAGSVDGPQHKRGPKMRSINEIIRRGELRRTENAGLSNGNAGTQGNHNGRKVSITTGDGRGSNKYTDRSSASKFEDENPAPRRHPVTQNDKPNPNRKKDVLTNGDGCLKNDILTNGDRCLAHWRNRMARKRKERKGNAESKHSNTEVGKCKSAPLKGLDLNVEYCGEKDEEEIIGELKQSTMADTSVMQSCSVFKVDELLMKGHTVFENLQTDDSHSRNAHSKLSEVRIFDKDLNPCIGTQENCDMTLPANKKNKRPRVEDGASSQAHWLKKQTGFELHNEGKKKQISMRTSEQQAEDDIHMKVVELLAKMQHEERLICRMSDNGSIYNSLTMTEGMKDGATWGIEGTYGSKVSDEMCWSISPKEPQSSITEYNHCTTIRNDGKVECTLKNYHSPIVNKPKHYIDLNQEAPISACTGCQAFSPSIGLSASEDQLSSIDPNGPCSPLNSHWNGMEVLALCSEHINHTASGHRSNSAHNGSSVLLNGTPVNFRKLDVGFSSNDIYMRGIPEPVENNDGYQMMIDMSGKRHLNCEGKPESSINEGLTSIKTFAAAVNGYHPGKMDQEDSNANDTISALNLLRLMDQAASSGEPHQSSIHDYYVRSAQQSNSQGNELLRSEVGVGSSEVTKIHRIVGTTYHDQQAGNPGQPLRPVARVGILGPHLQQEIATSSNISRISLGFRSRYSNEQSFLMTNATGKGEAFQPATVTKTMNMPTSKSRDVTSKRIPVGTLANPACSIASGDLVQPVNNQKNGTFQPIRSTDRMEECVVNRNPADFAMPEEYSEYMIGYKEPRTKRKLKSRNLQSPSLRSGKKRQKMIKIP